MNKRLLHLFNKAGFHQPEMERLGIEHKFEKFAELIVRECVDVAIEQKKWVEDMKVFNPGDVEWNQARIQQSQHIIDKIKQHFGVKK
jgi:hypothetical protein